MQIESLQNERIKQLIRLMTDNRFRKKAGLFVVEGKQENERTQQFGFQLQELYVCPEIYKEDLSNIKTHLISKKIYEKVAYRGTSEGIIGVYTTNQESLTDFKPKKDSSIIVVESLEKPGNLGAILRSCEAFGIDALIVADPKLDFYNPNVIRSSVGCLFGMNVFQSTKEEIYRFLTENQFAIYTTLMDETAKDIFQANFNQKAAILFGTEHSGLSDFWIGKGNNVLIPMVGTIDSLNLSNAVAITCYEVLRQKQIQ